MTIKPSMEQIQRLTKLAPKVPWIEFDKALSEIFREVDEQFRLSDDRHLVKVDSDGWTVQHPQSCRPNLFTCPWSQPHNLTIARHLDALEPEPAKVGYVYEGKAKPDSHGLGTVLLYLTGDPIDDGR